MGLIKTITSDAEAQVRSLHRGQPCDDRNKPLGSKFPEDGIDTDG
jgi:hypothetical protein